MRVLETASPPVFYLPLDGVRTDLLVRERERSLCEWKGPATYWSLQLGERRIGHCAWSYEEPFPAYANIRGYVSFYPSKVDCYVDEVRVAPQPGGFYGGWVTPDIVGPFKGEPGTGGW